MITARTARRPTTARGTTWRAALLILAPCSLAVGMWHGPTAAGSTGLPGGKAEDCAPTPARRGGDRGALFQSSRLRLVDLAIYDLQEQKVLYVHAAGGKHYWPAKYDLIPQSGVRTQWESGGSFTSADVAKIRRSDCYRTTVALNGVPLGRFDEPNAPGKRFFLGDSAYFKPCPLSKTCLYLRITQAAWAAAKPPWVLDIQVTRLTARQSSPADPANINEHGDVVPQRRYDYSALPRSRSEVFPNPQSLGSYFATRIYPTFQHARCQNCHALGSVAAVVSRHAALGPAFDGTRVSQTSSPTGPVISCNGGCHFVDGSVSGVTFVENEWKAPAFERDIDWRQKTAVWTCSRVKTNLPSEDRARHHFFEDARIAWAVHSGRAPYDRELGEAPPGSFAAWKKLLEPWLRGTMPCPFLPNLPTQGQKDRR